jgi:hypothetical protein
MCKNPSMKQNQWQCFFFLTAVVVVVVVVAVMLLIVSLDTEVSKVILTT